jgi:hypothetical protein
MTGTKATYHHAYASGALEQIRAIEVDLHYKPGVAYRLVSP